MPRFRRSTSRLSLCLIGLVSALLFCGCARPTVQSVYVELPAAPDLAVEKDNYRPKTFRLPAETWSLPALDNSEGAAEASTAKRINDKIAHDRLQLFKQLQARLLATYRRKADRLRIDQLAHFAQLRSDALDGANQVISEKYKAYADQKGPLVIRLALLAGFPDPDPESRRTPSVTDVAGKRQFAEMKDLRLKIKSLDEGFDAAIQEVLRKTNKLTDAQIEELRSELERQIATEEASVKHLAAEEFEKSRKELRPLLADQPPLALHAVPAATMKFPEASVQPPEVPSPVVSEELRKEPRNRLEAELRIWLSLNHYQLVAKGKGRDATQEFLRWKQTIDP